MKPLCLLAFCFVFDWASAQLHDAQWVIGTRPSILDFRGDTLATRLLPHFFANISTLANICDENGSLLYVSNGIFIGDFSGAALLNGNGLNPCKYTDLYQSNGLDINQGVLFLPKPGSNRYYYLFHFSNDSFDFARPTILYYSLIDKGGNNGSGEVIEKNQVLLNGVVLREGGMTACKHANGRDYWLIKGEYNSNRFYKFLVTPDGILGPYTQEIGSVVKGGMDLEYSKFSQDGSKFVTASYESKVLVMDFDRCNGDFSSPVEIWNNVSTDPIHHPISGAASVEFSPNSRFIYAASRLNVMQYDLWASPIPDSTELYYANDTVDMAQIDYLQIAPNGKLYISTWAGGYYFLHVISKPDEQGLACNFVYAGQPTPSLNSINLPNMINYKLGPLKGSECDTITDVRLTEDPRQIRIQPNPADKYLYVEMPTQGNYELQLINNLGQVIDKKQTPQVDIFDTENFPAGIYFIQATDKRTGKQIAAQRVSVVH